MRHFSNQAIKQLYVLVLGLDVIGNPFGFVRGVGTGVKDLFYEPYQVEDNILLFVPSLDHLICRHEGVNFQPAIEN